MTKGNWGTKEFILALCITEGVRNSRQKSGGRTDIEIMEERYLLTAFHNLLGLLSDYERTLLQHFIFYIYNTTFYILMGKALSV